MTTVLLAAAASCFGYVAIRLARQWRADVIVRQEFAVEQLLLAEARFQQANEALKDARALRQEMTA